MKSILIGIVVILWIAGVFFAFIHIVSKSMRSSQSPTDGYQPVRVQQDQSEKIKAQADQQRRLMEDRQRRMRTR